jgi:hypothetical protein
MCYRKGFFHAAFLGLSCDHFDLLDDRPQWDRDRSDKMALGGLLVGDDYRLTDEDREVFERLDQGVENSAGLLHRTVVFDAGSNRIQPYPQGLYAFKAWSKDTNVVWKIRVFSKLKPGLRYCLLDLVTLVCRITAETESLQWFVPHVGSPKLVAASADGRTIATCRHATVQERAPGWCRRPASA